MFFSKVSFRKPYSSLIQPLKENMDASQPSGTYLKTVKNYMVEYGYLGVSAVFSGTGLYLMLADLGDDPKKLGFGLFGAGLTHAIYGTTRRFRENKRERQRRKREIRKELRYRRMREDLRELTEHMMRDKGKRVRISIIEYSALVNTKWCGSISIVYIIVIGTQVNIVMF